MKVGIYLAGSQPELGGAHTFEQNIVNCLCRLTGTSHHEFVLFWEKKIFRVHLIKNFENLKTIPFVRQAKCWKLMRLIANKIFCWPLADLFEDPLQKAARQEGIEFMVFLTSSYCPIEVLTSANMWDIQHRLQPWFPEVNYRQAVAKA